MVIGINRKLYIQQPNHEYVLPLPHHNALVYFYPLCIVQIISYATNIGKATHIWICPHPTQVGPTLRVVLLLLVEISHEHASLLSGSRIAHQDLENSVKEAGMLIDIVQRYIWYVRIFGGRADGPSQDPKKGFVPHSFQNVPKMS